MPPWRSEHVRKGKASGLAATANSWHGQSLATVGVFAVMKLNSNRRRAWLGGGLAVVTIVYLLNASWLAPLPDGRATLLAHRGVYQRYNREGLGKDDCTAARMLPPTHAFLENSIPSMRLGFAAGADMLEVDVHPTTDGEFAVFHDWTIDCRTEGHGVTRKHAMTELKRLDIGFGYTADGGRTYPFRGQGVGMMPTLAEAFAAFPDRRFLINIKSRDPLEAVKLAAYLRARGIDLRRRVMVYGHERPIARWRALEPGAPNFDKASLKQCTAAYMAYGWTGILPSACQDGAIAVPLAWRSVVWGWPNRFLARMHKSNTVVMLVGTPTSLNGVQGITHPSALRDVPAGFGGMIWTDAVEDVGPAWRAQQASNSARSTSERKP